MNPSPGLRERAHHQGLDALTDAEALELYLDRSRVPEPAEAAARLLARYGGLGAILGASQRELSSLAGIVPAQDLMMVQDLSRRLLAEPLRSRCVLSSWDVLNAYVMRDLAHRGREQFRVLFLDKKNRLIADEVMAEGTVDHAPVYPREVMRRALELDASAVILVHNHPSGDPTPSGADVDMTRKVVEAGRALSIVVHDHLIVGAGGVVSFRATGRM